MKRHLILAAIALCGSALTAIAQPYTVRFSEPTSMKGRAIWNEGNKKYNPTGLPRPDAGGVNYNADSEWEQRSLPLGNGSIGANVMGSVESERITVNEKTLWRGGPGTGQGNQKGTPEGARHYWDVNKQSAHLIPEIRQAFLDGDNQKAAQLTWQNFNSNVPYEATGEAAFRFGSFTTLGELNIDTDARPADITGYTRQLSLDSAIATVAYDMDGTHYVRRTFISYPDNVMVLRFTASGGKPQTLRLAYTPNPRSNFEVTPADNDALLYDGRLMNNGMQYAVRLKAIVPDDALNDDVVITNDGGALTVKGAADVLFLFTADTDYAPNYDPDPADPHAYVGIDPLATTAEWMDMAVAKGYDAVFADHVADYRDMFTRVDFRLKGDGDNGKDTPQRLEAYRHGAADPGLETLYYQFGRYLLIASSRPGNLPANLQGIWHNNIDGPWRIDYHNNINLQMNYWPALTTNLTECAEPLTDFIRLLEKPGERTAKAYWGARGWAAGISANPFGFTAPLEGQDMSWNYNPMASSWLATHLWEYYDFTRDKAFLRQTAYPLIKGCAQFTTDFLWRHPKGYYTAAPSTSPEHGPIDQGTTFTHAVCREILKQAIEAARILKCDADEARQWQNVLDSIAPYTVGRYGQLMEWSTDIDDPKDQHRHVNHLYGLHPGSTITHMATPDLIKASRIVLEHRGDGATGWSMGWKLNQWARLWDGNHSYTLYRNLLSNGTADNLWDVHPPFQIDGNFGGTAGVTEMLLQSHEGDIRLLPALPDAWVEGHINGLHARGNFHVNIAWAGGQLTRADITSLAGERLVVRYKDSELALKTKKGKTYTVVADAAGRLSLKR